MATLSTDMLATAASAFLIRSHVGITNELLHDALLFTEMTCTAEHIAAILDTSLVRGAIERANSA